MPKAKTNPLTGRDELMTRAFWGVAEVIRYTDLPPTTVHWEVKKGDNFPPPEVILGTRGQIKAWRRQVIIDWFKKYQTEKARG